jgi:carboxypeptidase T
MSRRIRLIAALVAGATLSSLAPAARASDSWPAPFRTYEQVTSEILAAEAEHPEIVDVISIGESYEGRDIYVVKISDNVATEEGEPEVLIDALHHSNEHATVAQALDLLQLLTEGYGDDASITTFVDSSVIWVVPVVNPDGLVYDLEVAGGRNWRKNRQPTAGSSSIGTDLNRNYSAYWRCCSAAGGVPASRHFAGRARFSAPESTAMRDFVATRVIDGTQRIRLYLSMHAAGQTITWPILPRAAGIPAMTIDDRLTMFGLVNEFAARNGYAPGRYSPTGGTSTDWMYHTYKIPSLLLEIGRFTGFVSRFYPSASELQSEVAGNRAALLWFLAQAACPSEAAGLGSKRCGARFDDFEREAGWQVNPDGTDTATSGAFERADPAEVRHVGRLLQSGDAPSGYRALVTGAAAGANYNARDLDGVTTVRSPAISLGATPGALRFAYAFAYAPNASSADWFKVWVEGEDGARTLVLDRRAAARWRTAVVTTAQISLSTWADQSIHLVFGAGDEGINSTVEVLVDDVRIERP